MAWISDYYLLHQTGKKSRTAGKPLRKLPAFEEERLFYGTYWTKRRKVINGIWGTAYLMCDGIPNEIQKALKYYHNLSVLDYSAPNGRYQKGKAIFVADRPVILPTCNISFKS